MRTKNKSDKTRNLRATISIAEHVLLPVGVPNPVLLKDMELPAEATYVFSNKKSKLPQGGHFLTTIELFFGENRLSTNNVSLGKYLLQGIPPVPDGPEQIEIKASISGDQILSIALMNHITRKYRTLGFIDISDVEVPEIVPEPRTSTFEQLSNIFLNSQPREKGRPRRGKDISHKLTISLDEAFHGVQKNIEVAGTKTCPVCAGSGAEPGTTPTHCTDCQGTGWIKEVKQTDRGPTWHGKTCPTCDGDGLIISDPCFNCRGRTWVKTTCPVTVRIPPLIDSGAEVRLPHLGEQGRYGGPHGHLCITVTVAKHPLFDRVGHDISIYLPVSTNFAKKGGHLQVPSIEKGRSFLFNLPPNTRSGMTFRVYESEAYTLTATIDTYPPVFLFVLPDVKRRLQAIREALGHEDFELPDSFEVGADQVIASSELEQYEKAHSKQAQGIASSTQVMERPQNYAKFYTRRGIIYAERGNQARALADYNKALELDPGCAPAYDNRSVIYLFQNDPEQALADSNKALELDPNNAEYYGHRGTVYHFQGDSVRALADYDKALVLDPNNAGVYYSRGKLYASQKDLTMALADYDKALELNPDDITLYQVLGDRSQVYAFQKNLEKALADIDKVVEMNPNNARAYNNRGYIYFLNGELDSALTNYDKALDLDPTLVPAYNYRGKVYLEQACYEQAVEDLSKSLSLHPDDMYVCFWLGQAYQGAGEEDKAVALYRKVLETSQNRELCQEVKRYLEELDFE